MVKPFTPSGSCTELSPPRGDSSVEPKNKTIITKVTEKTNYSFLFGTVIAEREEIDFKRVTADDEVFINVEDHLAKLVQCYKLEKDDLYFIADKNYLEIV